VYFIGLHKLHTVHSNENFSRFWQWCDSASSRSTVCALMEYYVDGIWRQDAWSRDPSVGFWIFWCKFLAWVGLLACWCSFRTRLTRGVKRERFRRATAEAYTTSARHVWEIFVTCRPEADCHHSLFIDCYRLFVDCGWAMRLWISVARGTTALKIDT